MIKEEEVRKTQVQTSLQLKAQHNQNKEKGEKLLRKVTVKIRLERIDMQEEIMVETLLDSSTTGLVISLEFVRK